MIKYEQNKKVSTPLNFVVLLLYYICAGCPVKFEVNMPWLKNCDIPVGNKNIDKLKEFNKNKLNGLGNFQWMYVNGVEEMCLWYSKKVNGRTVSDWFHSSDTDEELNEKLQTLQAEEKLYSILPPLN